MKTFEIKGFWGYVTFILLSAFLVTIAAGIPIVFVWVTWNALVFETFHGPLLSFWQAALLTGIFAVVFKIVFQPQIAFQVKRVKNPSDLERNLHKLKNQDSEK